MANRVGRIDADGHARIQVGDTHIYGTASANDNNADVEFLNKLRSTDPRHDKKRIEELKGGLLEDSFRWVLSSPEFLSWRDDDECRVLWVKGDPGKGKTMLLCGIINELEPMTRLCTPISASLLSYFFCQGTLDDLNNATAVLRGLVYLIAQQYRSLIPQLRENIPDFSHRNARVAVTDLFHQILRLISEDPDLNRVYIAIDALDECLTDLDPLIKLIVSSTSPSIKWLISSRNYVNIQQSLAVMTNGVPLSLEVNEESVSEAVDFYIKYKVDQLAVIKKINETTKTRIQEYLSSRAHGTFLWVALVCGALTRTASRKLLSSLSEYPTELTGFYDQMMNRFDGDGVCVCVLATVSTVLRPITLKELVCLEKAVEGEEYIREIVEDCGSFLTIKNNVIYFIHQSAKDFLLEHQSNKLFPGGIMDKHEIIFQQSLEGMKALKRDIYNVRHPGLHVDEILSIKRDYDPLADLHYSCTYWIDHLLELEPLRRQQQKLYCCSYLGDSGVVFQFLSQSLLFWIEALVYLHSLSTAVTRLPMLGALLRQVSHDCSNAHAALVSDAQRFVAFFQTVIIKYPLQLYASCLVFSPTECLTRKSFQQDELELFEISTGMKAHWSAGVLAFRGTDAILDLAASPTNQALMAGDEEGTLSIWNASDLSFYQHRVFDAKLWTNHFSPNYQLWGGITRDGLLRVWDISEKRVRWEEFTRLGHDRRSLLRFSANNEHLAVAAGEELQVWDVATGALQRKIRLKLRFKSHGPKDMQFSSDHQYLMTTSPYQTAPLHKYKVATGNEQDVGHFPADIDAQPDVVFFLPDGDRIALMFSYGPFIIWNHQAHREEYRCIIRLRAHWLRECALSHNTQLLALAWDKVFELYSTRTGALLFSSQDLDHERGRISAVTFAPDDEKLILGYDDGAVWIWDVDQAMQQKRDIGIERSLHNVDNFKEGHFSTSGDHLVYASVDCDLHILERNTRRLQHIKADDLNYPLSLVSANSAQQVALVAVARDETTRLRYWDFRNSNQPSDFVGSKSSDEIGHVVLSPDGRFLAASIGGTVRVWDLSMSSSCSQRFPSADDFESVHSMPYLSFAAGSGWLTIFPFPSTRCFLWHMATGEVQTIHLGSSDQDAPCLDVAVMSLNNRWLVLSTWVDGLFVIDINYQALQRKYLMAKTNICFEDDTTITTQFGRVDLSSLAESIIETQGVAIDMRPELSGLGLNPSSSWVLWNGRRVMWLPAGYRLYGTDAIRIIDDTMIFVTELGRLFEIKLSAGARDYFESCLSLPKLEGVGPRDYRIERNGPA